MIKKKKEKIETPRGNPKGREDYYFFPNQRRSVKASSIEEATAKVKKK